MEAISFFAVFICLGAVVIWYAVNEEASMDGGKGYLGLRSGDAQPVEETRAKYWRKRGWRRSQNIENIKDAPRSFSALGEVSFANSGSDSERHEERRRFKTQNVDRAEAAALTAGRQYTLKSRGRRESVKDLYGGPSSMSASSNERFVEKADRAYREKDGERYRRRPGATSRLAKAPTEVN